MASNKNGGPKEYLVKLIVGETIRPYIIIAERMEITNSSILFYRNGFELSAIFPIQFTVIDQIEALKT